MRPGRKFNMVTIFTLLIFSAVVLSSAVARYQNRAGQDNVAKLAEFNVSVIDLDTMDEVSWDMRLPSTTRLFDDAQFNEIAVIKRVMLLNRGIDPVNIQAQILDRVSDGYHGADGSAGDTDDILIYFEGMDVQHSHQDVMQFSIKQAGYTLDNNSSFEEVKEAVQATTAANMLAWGGVLNPNNSIYMTVVVWREHSADNIGTEMDVECMLNKHLQLMVEQI